MPLESLMRHGRRGYVGAGKALLANLEEQACPAEQVLLLGKERQDALQVLPASSGSKPYRQTRPGWWPS